MSVKNSYLRKVEYEDIKLLLDWVNEADVRNNSFNSQKISFEEHRKWFLDKMTSGKSIFYIYCHKQIPIGQVRIDIDNDCGLINYSIDKQYRSQGHSKVMLSLINEALALELPRIKYLSAKVKNTNIASQRNFERMRYKKHLRDGYIEYILELEPRNSEGLQKQSAENSQKKKIIIRADGGQGIGMGHIIRTSVLAQELSNYFTVIYACLDTEAYSNGANYIRDLGFQVRLIYDNFPPYDFLSDADFIITDVYLSDSLYYETLARQGKRQMCIDDMNRLSNYPVDILLNQNIGAEKQAYNVGRNTKMLLGTQYTLLRREFRTAAPLNVSGVVTDILISMGASDPSDATCAILELVKDMNYVFHVVIGNSFVYSDKIKNIAKHLPNILLHINPNMPDIMNRCQLAVLACGSTVYEACALGLPFVGVITADNQICLANEAKSAGLIENILGVNDLSPLLVPSLEKLLHNEELRLTISAEQIKSINRNGVKRVTDTILSLLNS